MVLKLNLEEGRISLGMRQLQSDPWREIPRLYREGQVLRARVTREVDEGVVVRLPVGLDLLVPLGEELRRTPAVAESADEPVEAEAETETATEAAAEPTAEAAAEPTAEVAAPAEDAAEAAPVAAESAEPAEAAAAAEPESLFGFTIGQEIEVRVERLIPVERDMMLALASHRAAEGRGESSSEGERPRSAGQRTPLARGRYSDRQRDEGEDDRGADRGPTPAGGRRERRRERDRDDEREVAAATEATSAPARRTLGDLMGDKLRSLFQEEEPSDEGKE